MDLKTTCSNSGLDAKFVRAKLGIQNRKFLSSTQTSLDLAVEASAGVLGETDVPCSFIFYVTQNPTQRIPHDSALLHQQLKLSAEVSCVDIALSCSGYVHGLLLAESWLAASLPEDAEEPPQTQGLLVTADSYSRIVNSHDRSTSALFADAATATLVGHGGLFCVKPGVLGTDSANSSAIRARDIDTRKEALTNSTGDELVFERKSELRMDGRSVFSAAMQHIPNAIHATLEKFRLSVRDVDLFIFHQGSAFMLEQLTSRAKLPKAKVPIRLDRYGNCVSSTIPLILEEMVFRPGSPQYDQIMLCGFGVGFSWATALIERRKGTS